MMRTAPSSIRSCTTVAVSAAFPYITQVLTLTSSARGTSSQPSNCRRRLLSMALLQEIAQAAQRYDGRVAVLELLAQARYVDFDRVGRCVVVHGEQAVGERLLAHGLAEFDDQRLQHGVLARRQRQRPVAEREEARIAVVAQGTAFQHRILVLVRAPENGADPGFELIDVERLRHVV